MRCWIGLRKLARSRGAQVGSMFRYLVQTRARKPSELELSSAHAGPSRKTKQVFRKSLALHRANTIQSDDEVTGQGMGLRCHRQNRQIDFLNIE